MSWQSLKPPRSSFPALTRSRCWAAAATPLKRVILAVFERHAPGFDQQTIAARASSKGTFTALTITITATGPDQLDALHQDLLATGHVTMVL